jgi:hypothetical protein
MVRAWVGLAAISVVRCGRLRRTLNDGHAERCGKGRGVNRLEIGTCAVTLARLAATTRGSSERAAVTAGRTDSERQARRDSARANRSSSCWEAASSLPDRFSR